MKRLLKRYFSFQGRASRSQYWLRTLVFLVSSYFVFATLFEDNRTEFLGSLLALSWLPVWLWILIATSRRRCRDVGVNPHWLWMWLFPLVGSVFYIVLGCLKSDDGVRIARQTPKARIAKKGLVRYISVFGYATRQEYWCIIIPVTFAIGIASMIFLSVVSFLLASFEDYLLSDILYFSLATTSGCAVAWLGTATVVRRCRDAALDLRWSMVYLIPLWLFQIVSIPLVRMSTEQQTTMVEKFLLPFTQNFRVTPASVTAILLLLCVFSSYIVFGCLTSKEKVDRKPPTH